MKIAILQFPGSNCEAESIQAVRSAGLEAEEFLWNRDPSGLEHFDGYFIVGGFSYEDRSRAGIIASLDPLMFYVKAEAKKGKPVLGICNGAQILVETGLVPGLAGSAVGLALAVNRRVKNGLVVGTGFYNAWINIRLTAPPDSSAFTRHLSPSGIIRVPVAHGEGRFVIPEALLHEMNGKQLTVFRYCDEFGDITDEFPINPNGAVENLAAIINASGNVMAMMPHPERTEAGQPIFTSMREYIANEKKIFVEKPLHYIVEPVTISPYQPDSGASEIAVGLIISDNEAATVEATLKRLGMPVSIQRATHYEVPTGERAKLIANGELFNPRKEKIVPGFSNAKVNIQMLVRYSDDTAGQKLGEKLGMPIKHGVLWTISTHQGKEESIIKEILATNLFFNPYSQVCYSNFPIQAMPLPYEAQIKAHLGDCLTATVLGIGAKRAGKVRDTYDLGGKLIMITTDRLSAFDRVLAAIPYKGQVLNQTSAWWFEKTAHIVPNHLLSVPDPNVTIAKKCTVFPIEFVVRGYMTGSTSTSVWVNYEKGVREYCGNILPESMRKNEKFASPIVTPTTKSEDHDRLMSPDEIIRGGFMSSADWEYTSRKALELFSFGQSVAASHGLILVDTKYEFGKDENGRITLVDEIHTPDSSRYWLASSYEERMRQGLEPENIDKEFLRLWFKDHCDPYKDKELPPAPDELVVELSRRYIMLYEMITGEPFQFPDASVPIAERIRQNISPALPKNQSGMGIKTVLILGSEKDAEHAKKITDALDAQNIPHEQYVASAHREAAKLFQILDKYKDSAVIYITLAGRSNALSGFVAGNSNKITIACPPFADKIDMLVNIHSTLQMPNQVPVMTILEPLNVALAVKRILALHSL